MPLICQSSGCGQISVLMLLAMTVLPRCRSCVSFLCFGRFYQGLPNSKHSELAVSLCNFLAPRSLMNIRPYLSTVTSIAPSPCRQGGTQELSEETSWVPTKTTLRKLKVAELRDGLSQRGLDTTGKKEQLVERLFNDIQLASKLLERSSSSKNQNNIQSQIINDSQVVATGGDEGSNHPLDPSKTYVIRIKNAVSGQIRCLTGVGIGMTLKVIEGENKKKQNVLGTNDLLLPGMRKAFDADYCALIIAMKYAKARGIRKIIMEISDMGIMKQLTGQGRVGDGEQQKKLFSEAIELSETFDSFEIQHYNGENKCPKTEDLARTALARQRPLQSDWESVDPLTNKRTLAKEKHLETDPKKEYVLRFDGGARNNPRGAAGAGMVIYDGNNEVWCGWKFLGEAKTNNVAEYCALIEGLKCALRFGVRRIRAEGDSMLVVKQVLGQFQVKAGGLKLLHQEVKGLVNGFDSFDIISIPRAENARADFLANHAMNQRTSESADEIIMERQDRTDEV